MQKNRDTVHRCVAAHVDHDVNEVHAQTVTCDERDHKPCKDHQQDALAQNLAKRAAALILMASLRSVRSVELARGIPRRRFRGTSCRRVQGVPRRRAQGVPRRRVHDRPRSRGHAFCRITCRRRSPRGTQRLVGLGTGLFRLHRSRLDWRLARGHGREHRQQHNARQNKQAGEDPGRRQLDQPAEPHGADGVAHRPHPACKPKVDGHANSVEPHRQLRQKGRYRERHGVRESEQDDDGICG